MAIEKNSEICGVNLPYCKIGVIQADKNSVQITLQKCANPLNAPLHTEIVQLTDEQHKMIGDILVKAAYMKLKDFGILTGIDC